MILKYIDNNLGFANQNIFSVERNIFHSVEKPGGDSIVKQIRSTESKIQEKKLQNQLEAQKGEPQPEKISPPEDIVDENKVGEAVKTIEQRIDKSPVADKYKEQIRGSLSKLLERREKDFKAINADEEAQLKAVFEQTLKDLEGFNEQEGVKEIYDVIEPFFAKAKEIAQILNLETYRKESGYFETINKKLEEAGINKELLEKFQKMQGVAVDGKCGPETANKILNMLGVTSKVEFGEETKYKEEENSEENKEASLDQALSLITPEVAANIHKAVEKISEAEVNLRDKAQACIDNLTPNGESRSGHEMDFENYFTAYGELMNSMDDIVKIQDSLMSQNPTKEMNMVINDAMGKLYFTGIAFLPDPNNPGKLVLQDAVVLIPTSSEEYEELRSITEGVLLISRGELYARTRNPLYRKYFDKAQDQLTAVARDETQNGLKGAAAEDDKLSTGIDESERKELQQNVELTADKIITDFDVIQRLQVEDPLTAFDFAVKLRERLVQLQAGTCADCNINFAQLGKLPNLNVAFDQAVTMYLEKTEETTKKIVSDNKDVVEFKNDFIFFQKTTEGAAKSLVHLLEEIQKTGEAPSEHAMAQIKGGAESILRNPLADKLENSKGREFTESLKGFSVADEFGQQINLIKDGLQNGFAQAEKYVKGITNLCATVMKIEASPSTFLSFVKSTGGDIAIISAAIAGAALMAAAFAASGGLAAPALPAAATVIGNLVLGATVAGLGGAIGGQYAKAIVEGNVNHIETGAMLSAWGEEATVGLVFHGAGSVLKVGGKKAVEMAALKVGEAAQQRIAAVAKQLDHAGHGGRSVMKNVKGALVHETEEEAAKHMTEPHHKEDKIAEKKPKDGGGNIS